MVEKETGTTDLDRLGGLAKMMPVTFIACTVAALSISGIPPLNGFASKWMIYQGIIVSGGERRWRHGLDRVAGRRDARFRADPGQFCESAARDIPVQAFAGNSSRCAGIRESSPQHAAAAGGSRRTVRDLRRVRLPGTAWPVIFPVVQVDECARRVVGRPGNGADRGLASLSAWSFTR